MNTHLQHDNSRQLERYQVILGILFLASVVAVYVTFYEPVLHVDDWSQTIYRYTQGQLSWFAPTNRRPLLLLPFLLLFSLFGESIFPFYAIIGILTIFAGLQFYLVLRRLLPSMPDVAVLAAAVFLVFPADYTRMYLTMIGVRMAICLVLFYASLLLAYAESEKRYRGLLLVAALICLLISLGIYEAQLGIALAWPLLLAVYKKELDRNRRVALLSPLLIGILFALWRTVGMELAGISDRYFQTMQLAPTTLLVRLVAGLRVLILAWTEPVSRALGSEGQGGALLIIYAALGLVILTASQIIRRHGGSKDDDEAKERAVKRTLLLLAGGGLFTVAGYIPIIVLYTPSLNGRFSRTNIFASFGAAVVLVALLRLVALRLAPNRRQAARLLTAITLPFLILGVVTQAWVQYDANVAWEEQRQIWIGLLRVAPDLKEDTAVYIVMPGYEERYSLTDWRRAPLSADWEVTGALRVLYSNNSLDGDILLPDLPLPQAQVTRAGIVGSYEEGLTPYRRALFVEFDRASESLHVVEDLATALSLDWEVDGYDPAQRIEHTPVPLDSPWHRLIFSP